MKRAGAAGGSLLLFLGEDADDVSASRFTLLHHLWTPRGKRKRLVFRVCERERRETRASEKRVDYPKYVHTHAVFAAAGQVFGLHASVSSTA